MGVVTTAGTNMVLNITVTDPAGQVIDMSGGGISAYLHSDAGSAIVGSVTDGPAGECSITVPVVGTGYDVLQVWAEPMNSANFPVLTTIVTKNETSA